MIDIDGFFSECCGAVRDFSGSYKMIAEILRTLIDSGEWTVRLGLGEAARNQERLLSNFVKIWLIIFHRANVITIR